LDEYLLLINIIINSYFYAYFPVSWIKFIIARN